MLTIQQVIARHSNLQDSLNEVTTPNWKQSSNNYFRAYYKEAAEISDHIPWKWWKASTENKAQAFMEVVDMFHFWISGFLHEGFTWKFIGTLNVQCPFDGSLEQLNRQVDRTVSIGSLASTQQSEGYVEKTIVLTALENIIILTEMLGYTIEDLSNWYVGKCALNFFRQDMGYKDGTYVKTWAGKEDNFYLEHIINNAKEQNIELEPKEVWEALGVWYKAMAKQTVDPAKCSLPALNLSGQ